MKDRVYREVPVEINGDKASFRIMLDRGIDPIGMVIGDPIPDKKGHKCRVVIPLKDWPNIVKAVADMQEELEVYPEAPR